MKYLKWMALLQTVTQGPRIFLSSVIRLHHVASKVTLLFCIRCLKGQLVLCYCCFCLFALMDQAFPRARTQLQGHTSLQGEARGVGHFVPQEETGAGLWTVRRSLPSEMVFIHLSKDSWAPAWRQVQCSSVAVCQRRHLSHCVPSLPVGNIYR